MNLQRDSTCSILISATDWWSGFIVVDGTAEMTWSGNSDPEPLRLSVEGDGPTATTKEPR